MEVIAQVAILDHDQVYWGLEERALADLKPGDLVFGERALAELLPEGARYVDAGCDLPGGRYRWDAELARFEPLARAQRKEAPQAPTLEQAFYDFLQQGPSAPRVQAWFEWFRKTFDERRG